MRTFYLMAVLGLWIMSFPNVVRAQAPIPGQPYEIPPGYEGATVGSLIAYGGFNYVIQDIGTMLLAADRASQSDESGVSQSGQGDQVDQTAYQIPQGCEGYAAGCVIPYDGADYLIQGNGTMILAVGGCDIVDFQPFQLPGA